MEASRTAIAALVVITVSCLAAAPFTLAAQPATGRIEGRIVLSPAAPVARAGEPNERPIKGRVVIVNDKRAIVARAESNDEGVFQIDLAPGRYTLHLEKPARIGRASDKEIVVSPGQTARTKITLDSGIR